MNTTCVCQQRSPQSRLEKLVWLAIVSRSNSCILERDQSWRKEKRFGQMIMNSESERNGCSEDVGDDEATPSPRERVTGWQRHRRRALGFSNHQ